jgi:hypothetical protein
MTKTTKYGLENLTRKFMIISKRYIFFHHKSFLNYYLKLTLILKNKISSNHSSEEKIAEIVQNQLADFQKGWEALVSSIDANTRQATTNSEDLLTINSNVQNVENEIQKLSIKNQKFEKTSKTFFEKMDNWSNETHSTISQIQDILPEVFLFYFLKYKNCKFEFYFS